MIDEKQEGFREGIVVPLEGKMGTKAPDSDATKIQPGAAQNSSKKEPVQTNASLGEKKSDSGQNLLTSSQDVKRNKMQSTSNMVSMINGSAPKQQNASSSNKPDLIPAINLKNSMVA